MAFRMGLLGKKVGMTQQFDAKGAWACLCVVQTGPCVVLEVKNQKKHGYSAIQIGFDDKSERRTSRPLAGIFAKAGTTPKRFVREIRLDEEDAARFKPGMSLNAGQIFHPGDVIDVIGTSKGKGFQGVMKRYHFSGFRGTHGTHEYFRHGGSVGCRLTPGRVHRGKRMGGQMGNVRVTVQNLKVVEVLDEKNLLLLSGAVPGAPDTYLIIQHAAKRAPRPFDVEAKPAPVPEAQPAPEAAPPA
jgi:large subunit ribosomal protein L3